MQIHRDEVGNEIRLGDRVKVTCIDPNRGAYMWMDEAEVVGFGRTRVQLRFASYARDCMVGGETLKCHYRNGHLQDPPDGTPARRCLI